MMRYRSRLWFVALAALFVVGHAALAHAASPVKKRARSLTTLRTADPHLMDLLDQGLDRSQTLRDLEAHLEQSAVIVYMSRCQLPSGLLGRTRLIGADNGWKYLSLDIADRIGPSEALSILGHELQHVVEIADARSVVDESSMAAFYRQIGFDSGQVDGRAGFETREAVNTGHRVRAELSAWTG